MQDHVMLDQIKQHAPGATIPTGPDVKWRYMWRVGPRPADTRFTELNSEPVIPKVSIACPAAEDVALLTTELKD